MANTGLARPRKKKRLWWLLVIVALVLVFLIPTILGTFQASNNPTHTYNLAEVAKGNLSKTISASGSLAAADTADINAPAPVTVLDFLIEAGDSVKAGDVIATLDAAAFDANISTLRGNISDLERTVQQAYNAHSNTATVSSPYTGRIKEILVEEDDDVAKVMAEKGYLLMLSGDGKMRLELEPHRADHVKGEDVEVQIDGKSYDGVIKEVSEDKVVITFTDDGPELGDTGNVYDSDGNLINGFNGDMLKVNTPLYIVGESGTVSDVHKSLGTKVYSGSSLLGLEDVPFSSSYNQATEQLEEARGQLVSLLNLQRKGVILADADGIVASIAPQKKLQKDEVVASILTGGATKLNVNIDELDIGTVKEGQQATVLLDAFGEKRFHGEVTKISGAGTSNAGVTNYIVTINLESNDEFRIGMNANATIIIEEKKDVLLIPLMAVQYSREGDYVWVQNGELPSDPNADPGEKVFVTVGLSDAMNAEIASGNIKEGDKVVIVSAVTADSIGGMGGMGGFQMGGGNVQVADGGGPVVIQEGGEPR